MRNFFRITLALLFAATLNTGYAQIKIGDNPGTIDPSAVLDVESTTKGLLLPRMTTAEMNLIATPADGLMIYNTTANCTYLRKGGVWTSLCSAVVTASNGLVMVGNDVQLGGSLTSPAVIATSATNTLSVTGLGTNPSLAPADNQIVTVDPATGTVYKTTIAQLLANQTSVWKLGGNATGAVSALGSTDNFAVPFISNGVEGMRINPNGSVGIGIGATAPLANLDIAINPATPLLPPLRVTGLPATVLTGAAPSLPSVDEIMTIDPATGIVHKTAVTNILAGQSVDWKIVGNAGTTAGTNFIGTTDAIDFVTKTAGAERMRIAGATAGNVTAGNVGIGTATPTSTFQVAGSVAMPIVNQSAAYTVLATDHTVITDCSGGARLLTLPDPATCSGRSYILIKGDATNNILSFSRAISLSTAQTMSSVNYNVRLHIQSDGTNWWLIARF